MRRSDHPILFDPPVLAAAIWCLLAHTLVRRRLRRRGLQAQVLTPPRLPERGARGVTAMLAVRQATCLERSLVLQRWLGAHGTSPDVLIGVAPRHVTPPRSGAMPDVHAWLDGVDDDGGVHEVLHRIRTRT